MNSFNEEYQAAKSNYLPLNNNKQGLLQSAGDFGNMSLLNTRAIFKSEVDSGSENKLDELHTQMKLYQVGYRFWNDNEGNSF